MNTLLCPRLIRVALCAAALLLTVIPLPSARADAPADPVELYGGAYRHQEVGVILLPVADHHGDFTGVIRKGQKEYPLTATTGPRGLAGKFQSDGQSFDFTASLQDGSLRLISANTTYTLEPAGVPQGYQTLAHSDMGRALIAMRDSANSARALLRGTLDDLGTVFDAKCELGDGMIAEDDQAGAVSFTGTLMGRKITGLIIASAGQHGGVAIAAYGDTDALGQQLPPLLGKVRAMFTPMEQAAFPDGSGSIALPAGWKVVQVHNGCPAVAGPEGQMVALGQHAVLVTPEAARGSPWQLRGLPVVAFDGPVETMKTLWTKFSQTFNPPIRLVDVSHAEDQTAPVAAAKQAHFDFTCDLGAAGQAHRYAGQAIAITTPPGADGSWKCDYSAMLAPEALYARDLPLMTTIWNSWHINGGAVIAHAQSAAVAELSGAARSLEQSAMKHWEGEKRQFGEWDDVISGCGQAINTSTGQLKWLGTQSVYELNQQGTTKYKKFP